MRRKALVARMKLPSNMAAQGIEPGSRCQEPKAQPKKFVVGKQRRLTSGLLLVTIPLNFD